MSLRIPITLCERGKKPIKTRAVISSGGVKSNAILCANVFCKLETHKLSFSPSVFVGSTGPERLLCLRGSECFLVCSQAPGITVPPQPSQPKPMLSFTLLLTPTVFLTQFLSQAPQTPSLALCLYIPLFNLLGNCPEVLTRKKTSAYPTPTCLTMSFSP